MNNERFSEAFLELYQPDLSLETYAALSYRFISKLVPNEFIAFGSLDLKGGELNIGLSEDVPAFIPSMHAFGDLMGQYDLFNWDPEIAKGKPFSRSDFFSDSSFKDLDIYAEVYRRLGIDNHCAVHVPSSRNEINFLASNVKAALISPARRKHCWKQHKPT